MNWVNLLALAVALAMDAFAVAVVAGLTIKALTKRHVFRLSFHFGLFQGLMPAIGWAAGFAIHKYIAAFDHWIAFGLLAFIGVKMVWGALSGADETPDTSRDPTSGWSLVILSIATSIDALAVGLSLGVIGSTILAPVLVIGIVAAAFTVAGMFLGRQIGLRWGKRVEVLGGIILLGIGIKIVLEHVTA
ncbi:MAG: manganese efflux pump [Acidobacteria bacterium]|nr:manganese efflux pump [Acidobacteriota bacterium]